MDNFNHVRNKNEEIRIKDEEIKSGGCRKSRHQKNQKKSKN
jgi:hypothetical protein